MCSFRFFSFVGSFILGALLAAPIASHAQADFRDPIAYTGHGTLFDRDGNPIEATPGFVAQAQQEYIETLLKNANEDTQLAFRKFRARLDETLAELEGSVEEKQIYGLMTNSALLDWLTASLDPQTDIRTHNGQLNYLLKTAFFGTRSAVAVPPKLAVILEEIPTPSGVVAFSTFNQGQAYVNECAANGVPIPPDWGSSQWTEVGSLDDSEEFISASAEARVFKYRSTSPEGTCIALPRFSGNGSGDIALLGIICLGKQTSKACFWDNQKNAESFTIGANESKPLSAFGGGAELALVDEFGGTAGGVCTSCHAGENPYVIHPGTSLGQPALGDLITQADNWYDPLVHPDWPQNPGPSNAITAIPGSAECTGCHSQTGGGGRFPQLSSAIAGYCGTILRQAVQKTMPVGSPGSSEFSSHVVAMQALCANVATPILRIESELLSYGDVELGFSFAKALVLHNDGNANLTVSVSRTTPNGDPDLAHWDEVNELSNFSIAPGDPPVVLRQVYEPQALGSHSIELQVASSDNAAPATTITLAGSGVTPRPIDSLLVLDRSGSMSDPAGDRSKIEAMRDSVMLYTDLLRQDVGGSGTGDKLGFVKYNASNSVYMSMTTITNGLKNAIEMGELSDGALSDPNRILPDGRTGIGGAMLTGANELGGPVSDRGTVMVVLTDGKENEDPSIATAISDIQTNDPHIQMYSVGLGFDIEPTKLQSITNMGDEGYHQVVSTLRDETLYDLETFYFKIFSSATGMDMVTDPTHVINLQSNVPIVVDRARVISSDRNATFLVLDDPMMRQLYELEFLAPDGAVMSPGTTIGGIPIQEQIRNNYRIYRIIFPDVSQADSYVGDWVLRLVPNGNWTRSVGKNLAAESRIRYGGIMHPVKGQVPIGFAGAVSSDYHLEARIATDSYLPGADLKLNGTLTDRGWPAPNGDITVTITRPDSVVHTIVLHDDGSHGDGDAVDATWANTYSQTAVPGVYKLLFRSVGSNERGELAPRLVQRYVTLQRPEPPPTGPGDGNGNDPSGRCDACEGSVAAYLIGNYDVRGDSRSSISIMNPTGDPLEIVVSLFDDNGSPFQCARDKLGPNDILEFEVNRFDLPSKLGVVKVVAFDPRTDKPRIGIVGNQSRLSERGLTETSLHPVSRNILAGDIKRILSKCQ